MMSFIHTNYAILTLWPMLPKHQLLDLWSKVAQSPCRWDSAAFPMFLVLFDRFFFITCRLLPQRYNLTASEFERLGRVISERRKKYHFLLTAWVFLPDHVAGAERISAVLKHDNWPNAELALSASRRLMYRPPVNLERGELDAATRTCIRRH